MARGRRIYLNRTEHTERASEKHTAPYDHVTTQLPARGSTGTYSAISKITYFLGLGQKAPWKAGNARELAWRFGGVGPGLNFGLV
jgi:hypothetical protein